MKKTILILTTIFALNLNAQYAPLNTDSVRAWKTKASQKKVTLDQFFICQQPTSFKKVAVSTCSGVVTSTVNYFTGYTVGGLQSFTVPCSNCFIKIVDFRAAYSSTAGTAWNQIYFFAGALPPGTFADHVTPAAPLTKDWDLNFQMQTNYAGNINELLCGSIVLSRYLYVSGNTVYFWNAFIVNPNQNCSSYEYNVTYEY